MVDSVGVTLKMCALSWNDGSVGKALASFSPISEKNELKMFAFFTSSRTIFWLSDTLSGLIGGFLIWPLNFLIGSLFYQHQQNRNMSFIISIQIKKHRLIERKNDQPSTAVFLRQLFHQYRVKKDIYWPLVWTFFLAMR